MLKKKSYLIEQGLNNSIPYTSPILHFRFEIEKDTAIWQNTRILFLFLDTMFKKRTFEKPKYTKKTVDGFYPFKKKKKIFLSGCPHRHSDRSLKN